MARQGLRCLRRAVAGEVARTGADHRAHRRQGQGDHGGVLELADAQGQVHALLDQVDLAVVEVHVEDHPRMPGHEAVYRGGEVHQAEGEGGGETNASAQGVLGAGDGLLRLRQVLQQLNRPWVEGAAGLGEGEAARGALDQQGAQILLELRHPPADHRFSQSQAFRGRAELTRLNHGDKAL